MAHKDVTVLVNSIDHLFDVLDHLGGISFEESANTSNKECISCESTVARLINGNLFPFYSFWDLDMLFGLIICLKGLEVIDSMSSGMTRYMKCTYETGTNFDFLSVK